MGRAPSASRYHAAQAVTVSRTGKVPRTHSGARAEFTRLAQAEPAIGRANAAFLGRAYELKAFADYDRAEPVTLTGAADAIAESTRFVEAVAAVLAD